MQSKLSQKDTETGKSAVEPVSVAYGTGRRKESVARVWLKPGNGDIMINGRKMLNYFPRSVLQALILQPFSLVNRMGRYSVFCTVNGGGLSGQAGAIRHGISRALLYYEPDLRSPLKSAGMLTRDRRSVERKKYGLMKARRSFQFSKR